MSTLNSQAEQIFGYLPVGFIQAKKTAKGYSFTYSAGKPNEIDALNSAMISAGANNKNGAWFITANEDQTMEDAVNLSKAAYIKNQNIENAERYGFSSVEAYKSTMNEALK